MKDFECCEEKAPFTHKGEPMGKFGDKMAFHPCGHLAEIVRLHHGKLDWMFLDPKGLMLYCDRCKKHRNVMANSICCGVESQYLSEKQIPTYSGGPYDFARRTFDTYAAMDAPHLPTENGVRLSALQVMLHRWHVNQFDNNTLAGKALGISEELGEAIDALLGMASCAGKISHAILKHEDGIRGMDDELAFRKKLADSVADNTVFSIQLCTLLRLDYGALLQGTIDEVLKRDWKAEKAKKRATDSIDERMVWAVNPRR